MTIEEKNKLFGFDEECPNDIPAEEMMVKPFKKKPTFAYIKKRVKLLGRELTHLDLLLVEKWNETQAKRREQIEKELQQLGIMDIYGSVLRPEDPKLQILSKILFDAIE